MVLLDLPDEYGTHRPWDGQLAIHRQAIFPQFSGEKDAVFRHINLSVLAGDLLALRN